MAAKAMVTRKTIFQVRNLSSASSNGSNKGWLRKLRIALLCKDIFGLGPSDLKPLMSLLRKKVVIEIFLSVESQEISDGCLVSFYCSWTQFLYFEKVIQEICYEGGRGLERISLD